MDRLDLRRHVRREKRRRQRGVRLQVRERARRQIRLTVDAQEKVAPHAGHHVIVKGTVDGSALKLTSIEMAK